MNNDKDLEKAIDKMIETKKKPDDEIVGKMQRFISSQMLIFVNNKEYDQAEKYEYARQLLNQLTDPCSGYYRDQNKRKTEEQQYQDAKDRLQEVIERNEKSLKSIQKRTEEKLNELKLKHKEEKEKFVKDWNDPKFLAEFFKPSRDLIELRSMERKYAMNKQFAKAKEINNEIVELEKIEAEQQKQKAERAMNTQRKQLFQRQKNRLL